MSMSATVDEATRVDGAAEPSVPRWQMILFYLATLALFGLALWMRLHDLGLAFDRDGYDEGVYWQSLRAMSAGHALYQDIFYSQPPFFLLSLFPFFSLFGHSLWAARFGVAILSLFGLLGAFLLGRALSGRIGALAALLLLVADPTYLAQAQTIQAEAPSLALSLLAVGLAYLWWKKPEGIAGYCAAIFAGVTLALSILTKLFGLAALVPIGLLFLAQLYRLFAARKEGKLRKSVLLSLLLGVVAFIITTGAVLLPFSGSFSQLIQGVISFHTAAANLSQAGQSNKLSTIETFLLSITALAAVYGTIVALLRRDWRVVPLLAWLLATLALLDQQTPLFHHHLVILVPPLIGLALMGIGPVPLKFKTPYNLLHLATLFTLVMVLIASILNGAADVRYYADKQVASQDINVTKWDVNVERDLQSVTRPGDQVLTDAQFLTAIANRDTPPSLVDTSAVRIDSGYLTVQQLIAVASQPQVRVVLFYTSRLLRMKHIGDFYAWLMQHFHRYRNYYTGKELWVKV